MPGRIPPANPSWGELVRSFCPVVRELEAGERPQDWIDDSVNTDGSGSLPSDTASELPSSKAEFEPLPPQRYKVQFTAGQEYVDLLERAGDLLAHTVQDRRNRTLEEVQLRALRLLVDALEKRKYATTDQPRSSEPSDDASERAASPSRAEKPRRRGRGRYVPAAVRRAVWKRDEGRCTYVAATGQRCRETGCLELHHEEAYARGGPPTESNLSLRCRAHNALAAEEDFGGDFMAEKKQLRPAPARVRSRRTRPQLLVPEDPGAMLDSVEATTKAFPSRVTKSNSSGLRNAPSSALQKRLRKS